MQKINFINEETPDLSAETLNQLQTNIENAIKTAIDETITTAKTGWYEITSTFTYSSWNSSTKTAVISSENLTNILSVGMKVKFAQNNVTKYAIITALTSSAITLFMGTDYTLENTSINDFYFSMLKAPFDFPMNPEKWELTFIRNSNDVYSTVTTANCYGGANNQLTIPVGAWEVEYNYTIQFTSAGTTCYSRLALSQSSSEITAGSLTSNFVMPLASGSTASFRFINSKNYNLTEQTTFYLLFKNDIAYKNLYFVGSATQPSWIKAKCSYL